MSSGKRRNIVITGVSRGLGRALVGAFANQGHTVVGCARSQDAISELTRQWPSPHQFSVVDVTDDSQVKKWADQVLASGPPPDLLINNAGLINRNEKLWRLTAVETDRVIDVNIKGVMNVIRHFVPSMVDRGRGIIVNFSSGWGRSTAPLVAPYCATKWAIEGLTQSLAQELPGGLAAVPVSPGIINTDMLKSCFGEDSENFSSPELWAEEAAQFLLKLDETDNGNPRTI